MFLRICPYFPFNARVCVNQQKRLARQLEPEGITFRRAANAFVQCAEPERLQQLADSLTLANLDGPVQHWMHEPVTLYGAPGSKWRMTHSHSQRIPITRCV